MLVKLLSKEYLRSDKLYKDFLNNMIIESDDHFDDIIITLDEAPDFPIYLFISDDVERAEAYISAIKVIEKYYLKLPRDTHFDGQFWQTLLLIQKRDYILETYPEVIESETKFMNVVLKKFDWENYIYKCILAAQYISDNIEEEKREKYYKLIAENLDVYNYIIKYEIFRNDQFLIKILDIIKDNQLSDILKAKIKGREDLGDDERYGRRVIFELNKVYPVIMVPLMSKEELERLFLESLSKYMAIN